MKPVLIYSRERTFKNDKFVLDFSDKDQNVASIEFDKNSPYLIASLNCKLQLKKTIHANSNENKKAVTKLSEKSRLLLTHGSDHFCDIDVINSVFSPKNKTFNIVNTNENFYFYKSNKNLKNYSYTYRFCDEKEKKIRNAEIYSPYAQFSSKGLTFKQKITNIEYVTRLDKELEEIHSYFYSVNIRQLLYDIGLKWYRYLNLFYVKDENIPPRQTSKQRWFTTNIDFFNEAICAKVTNSKFKEDIFAQNYYTQGKGEYVIGTFAQRLKLGGRKYLMPLTYVIKQLRIATDEPFFVSDTLDLKTNTFLKDANIKDLGVYDLTDKDREELQKTFPGFNLYKLHKFVCEKRGRNLWKDELLFYPETNYQSFGQPTYDASLMLARPNADAFKYREYLNSDRNIFVKLYFRKIPSTLSAAELLFDKDVSEIKELVKQTKPLVDEIADEQKNLILYDNSSLIQETFFTELKKDIATDGMISTYYKRIDDRLITSKNRLEFIVIDITKKKSLT